nr:unnamed protein product [Spirometra erinaceieuropaei]
MQPYERPEKVSIKAMQMQDQTLCQWNNRLLTNESGPYELKAVIYGDYWGGWIGKSEFYDVRGMPEICKMNSKLFRCKHINGTGNINFAKLEIRNISNVYYVNIMSEFGHRIFPITFHRVSRAGDSTNKEQQIVHRKMMGEHANTYAGLGLHVAVSDKTHSSGFHRPGYPCNFVILCLRKRDGQQNCADPKFWLAIPYSMNVSEAVSRLLAPLGVGVVHRPAATIRRQLTKLKDRLPRQETSGGVYRICCGCGQSNHVGETGRLLRTRIAEHEESVQRNDANSQFATHSTRPGHTLKFDEAEILARGDNHVSRELLESWFTGPQSINKCNDIPTPYSVLRHMLAKIIHHSGSAQAGEPAGRAIITPASNMDDDISAINNFHAGHQSISAPAGNNP